MNTKTCTKCGMDKPYDCFYPDKRQKTTGTRPSCKFCDNLVRRERYKDDPEEKKRKNKLYQSKVRREQTIYVLKVQAELGCVDCGEKDPVVLDFDHVTGTKSMAISKMLRHHTPWDTLKAEIAKCEVRCANCHRRKTAKKRGYYADIDLAAL